MKATGTRAALYARISTREGRQHLDNQLAVLREFAHRMNWEIVTEYTDRESGANKKRPGLEQMMKDAAQRRFDLVAVFDLSRLTRGGPAEAFFYIARLSQSRVEFWSATEEHFRTCGKTGEIFIAIAAHIAEQERTMMRHRIRAGQERARRNGTVIGRPTLIIDRARILKMREQGKSIRQIAAALKAKRSTVYRRMSEAP
jgi:DNA invertase Pin-like site-specific DNA recombinase